MNKAIYITMPVDQQERRFERPSKVFSCMNEPFTVSPNGFSAILVEIAFIGSGLAPTYRLGFTGSNGAQ